MCVSAYYDVHSDETYHFHGKIQKTGCSQGGEITGCSSGGEMWDSIGKLIKTGSTQLKVAQRSHWNWPDLLALPFARIHKQ